MTMHFARIVGKLVGSLFCAACLFGQAPTFTYLETSHFDVVPNGPARGVGDVDGDGDFDALFGSELYRNDGKAFFTRAAALPTGTSGLLVDLDGDGRSEVVQVESSRGGVVVAVHRWTGAGWQNVQNVPLVGVPGIFLFLLLSRSLVHGDLDGDGDTDVLFAFGGTFQLLRNDAGVLVVAPAQAPQAVPGSVLATAVADLNGDGRRDVVCLTQLLFSTSVVAFEGAAGGGFLPPQTIHQPSGEVPVAEHGLQVGDFDGDGDVDLAYTRRPAGGAQVQLVQVLRNDRPGWTAIPTTAGGLSEELAVGVSRRRQATPQLLIQARDFVGTTMLAFANLAPSGLQWTHVEAFDQVGAPVAEVDLDGDLDIDWLGTGLLRLSRWSGADQLRDAAVVNPHLGRSTVDRARLQLGRDVLVPGLGRLQLGGGLSRVPPLPNGLPVVDSAFWSLPASQVGVHLAVAADRLWSAPEGAQFWFDLQGLLHDVRAVAVLGSTRAVVACSDFPGGLAVLANGVQVDPAASLAIPAPRLAGQGFHPLLVADLEGDGHQDVIHDLRWLRSTANVTLQDAGDLLPIVPVGVRDLATLDFDGDGDLDVYVARAGLDLLLELQNGAFVDVTIGRIPTENSDCGGVQVGDLDGDGDPDVLLLGTDLGFTAVPPVWLRNDGGVFARLPFPRNDVRLLADVDEDGDPDALTSTLWLRNTARQMHLPRLPALGAPFVVDLHANGPAASLPWGLVAFGPPAAPAVVAGIEGQLAIQSAGLSVLGVRPLLAGVNPFVAQVPNSALLFGMTLATQALWIEQNGRLWLSPVDLQQVW